MIVFDNLSSFSPLLLLSSLSILGAKVRLFYRISKLFNNKISNYNIFVGLSLRICTNLLGLCKI